MTAIRASAKREVLCFDALQSASSARNEFCDCRRRMRIWRFTRRSRRAPSDMDGQLESGERAGASESNALK